MPDRWIHRRILRGAVAAGVVAVAVIAVTGSARTQSPDQPITRAEDMGVTPGDLAPTVLSSSYVDESKGLRSLTVVYWSGVRFSA
jgi:hypothetical protein